MGKRYAVRSFVVLVSLLLTCFAFAFSAENKPSSLGGNEPLILPGILQKMENEVKKDSTLEKKICPQLKLQIQLKNSYKEQPTSARLNVMQSMGMRTKEFDKQLVFIHVKRKLSGSKIKVLRKMRITVYEDSWTPPLENYPTGFILANMPIDQLYALAKKGFVVRLETAEQKLEYLNDKAAQSIHAVDIWNNYGFNGAGVKIAILDSGLDTTHPDIPEPVASKSYSNYPNNSSNSIADEFGIGHGTHVTGSALGRGTQSNGKYKGMAPGADLIFFRMSGPDDEYLPKYGFNYAAFSAAINDAVDKHGADIISISMGEMPIYPDGSDPMCQAIANAFNKGTLVFASAGNDATSGRHYSGTVSANSETDLIEFTVNTASSWMPGFSFDFRLNWFDGVGVRNDLDLKLYSDFGGFTNPIDITAQSILFSNLNESVRGTELEQIIYSFSQGYFGKEKFYLKVKNKSNSNQLFHIYSRDRLGSVTFKNPDSSNTILSPALGDKTVAVGSYATRTAWWNYKDERYNSEDFGLPYTPLGAISSFSSRGPRIDGTKKPDIAAPGQEIISTKQKHIRYEYL
ncbi:MAG: S8 family serine peptidase [Planctomycetia bacterium]|nr:S8 family serine peptidase [Planctomycetia bacterium]